MKKLTTILTITLSIFLTGCFALPNSQYNEMMTNGKSAVIEGDYDKAINYFKLALEQKSGDNEATNLIDQLEILSGITKEQQDDDIDVYIHKLENIDNINDIKTKTSLVKNEANGYKQVLLSKIDAKIDDIEDEVKSKKYEDSKYKLELLMEKFDKRDDLKNEFNRCKEILKQYYGDSDVNLSQFQNEQNEISNQDTTSQKDKTKEQTTSKKDSSTKGNTSSNKNTENKSNLAYCNRGSHYTNPAYIDEDTNGCIGCFMKRVLSSSSMWTECSNCGDECSVDAITGRCHNCGSKQQPAVVEIRDDGTIIYEGGQ